MSSLRTAFSKFLPSNAKSKIQKLLLGYHSFAPSFASAGEDMILRHILGSDKQDGFYVDVGAYHPVIASNTYFFYSYGWRGINIEARPGSKALFDRERPQDINLECGISDNKGELTYYMISDDSTMNSFSREHLNSLGMLEAVKSEIKVPTFPLSYILEHHLPDNQVIDFISVDVEGHDLTVLKSNNWNRFRPKLLVVEDSQADPKQSDIVSFMRDTGYTVCAQNVIVLDRICEYFFIEESYRKHYWD
jgi:FkbM family methyltransferase